MALDLLHLLAYFLFRQLLAIESSQGPTAKTYFTFCANLYDSNKCYYNCITYNKFIVKMYRRIKNTSATIAPNRLKIRAIIIIIIIFKFKQRYHQINKPCMTCVYESERTPSKSAASSDKSASLTTLMTVFQVMGFRQ